MSERAAPSGREAFKHFVTIPTRWNDNDAYGHVNNAVYYNYFDTLVNGYLIGSGALNVASSTVIALVAETQCRFFRQISYPSPICAGLRLEHLGRSSLRYGIGLFADDGQPAAAQGHFVHVCVDRVTGRPVPIPEKLKAAVSPLRQ